MNLVTDPTPAPPLRWEGSAMRTGSPPLPSQREGVPCGLILYDFEACVINAAAPLLLGGVGGRLPQRQQLPSHRRGGVRGGVSNPILHDLNFSVDPLNSV
jgi:hypothetical protein